MSPLPLVLPHFRHPRRCSYSISLLRSLVTTSILLTSVNAFGTTTNHPPSVSWIRDQFVGDQQGQQTAFEPVYFRAWDKETDPLNTPTVAIEYGQSPPFLNTVTITPCGSGDTGCPDHGFKVIITEVSPTVDGSATIVVTATDGGGASAYSSFTLRRQSGAVNPPVIGGIPNEQIKNDPTLGYGPVWFVVDDLNAAGVDDTLDINGNPNVDVTGTSDNTDLVGVVTPLHVGGLKWSLTIFPNPNATPGRAVITITVAEKPPGTLKISTSFVLTVVDSSNTPPSFVPVPDSESKSKRHLH